MGVEYPAELGGYQPICDICGISLCYEVEPVNYELHRDFWDNWRCEVCDPNYFERWKNERRERGTHSQAELGRELASGGRGR